MEPIDNSSTFTDITKVESQINEKLQTTSEKRAKEKQLVRKLDLRIMPLFCLFYFADFLDRANIGNAALAGLQKDLNMNSAQLSTAISAFFITYILFEIPSNLILEKTNAARWLSFIMFIWGFATLSIAFVDDFTGLVIARLLLGAAESGFIPGILYLLSKMYTPQEFTMRVSILLTMSTTSGAVSGPLAYVVFEGVPTIILSFVSYYFLFNDLQDVNWLTDEQKLLQSQRLVTEKSESHKSTLNTLWTALSDWKTWAFSFLFFFNGISIVSFGVFSPVLINGFGFDASSAQLLTAPPCLTGTFGILIGGFLITKYEYRAPFLIMGALIVALSYLCLFLTYNKWASYSIMLIIPLGIGLQASATFGWSALNYPNLSVRAIAVATIIMIGNIGCVVGSFLFKTSDGPHYSFALLINFGAAILSSILAGLVGIQLHRLNRRIGHELNTFKYCI